MSFPMYQVKKEEPEEEPANTSASLPQIVSVVSGTAASGERPGSTGSSSAGDSNVPPANAPAAEKESGLVASYASPAWYFFGVPGGSSNLQREPIVYCLLCQVQVKRGTVPGKLGTTCLFTHLERRHNLTREEVFDSAAAAGYCGPIITPAPTAAPAVQAPTTTTTPAAPTSTPTTTPGIQTWECSNDGCGLVLIPVKRAAEEGEGEHAPKRQATTAPVSSSKMPDLAKCQTTTAPATSSEPAKAPKSARHQPTAAPATSSGPPGAPDLSKRQALSAPATSSGPSGTSDLSSTPSCSGRRQRPGGQGRASSYRQALRDRLLSSVHMYCEVCHALILSGERSQSARDLALETHFSSQHPHMFNRLKRGAARDARLGGLGPSSGVPAGSL